jgi:hypothetical protein
MLIDDFLLKGFRYAPDAGAEAAPEAAEEQDESAALEVEEPDAPEEREAAASQRDAYAEFEKIGLPKDPKQAASQLQYLQQQAREAEQYRQWYQYQAYQNQQVEAAKKQEAAEKQAQEQRKKLWELPQFDRRLLSQLTTDEYGNVVAKPGAIPTLPEDWRKWRDAREDAMDQALNMLADPVSFYESHLQAPIQRQVVGMAARITAYMLQEYQEKQRLQDFENQNREWVYDEGNQLTPAAHLWNRHYAEARNQGHPDPIRYATDALDAELYRRSVLQGAAESQGDVEDQKRMELLKRGARAPGRGGAVNGKKKAPRTGSDVWAEALEQMEDLPKEDFEKV